MVEPPRWERMSFHHRGRPARRMDAVYRTDTSQVRRSPAASTGDAIESGKVEPVKTPALGMVPQSAYDLSRFADRAEGR